ncbi:conserved hypothetical protein [Cupriavidus taiwanensis]|uniref:hypothetical protein n=1 Tax=Cupriavidus taiwanensis TaxID=164546 RepID=UPI000E124A90|nr:hypothetical protein [Cupriavidus taiwanensis]SOY78681.1 conserved hypothetical protein [Cupriavidus taiwanensis]SOY80465.1 conserved hypothetical protein [Cupriavidus taiwanensis]
MSNLGIAIGGIDTEHLNRISTSAPKPLFSGAWSTVELQPDIFVPQRFTVGVVVQSPGDRLHFKLLDDFKKFECVYLQHFPQKSLRELMAYAEEALRKAVHAKTAIPEIRFDTNCLVLSSPHYTSGDDLETTVERLYAELVVMAPSAKKKGSDFESIDTPRARQLVNAELKRIAGLDFERFVLPEKQGMFLEGDEGVKHFLDLNLLTSRSCGSVTSAAYKSAQSVEMNLLKASLDLTTYSRIRKLDSIGLFLLLPDASAVEPKEYKKIVEVIDEHEWKLERDGFRVTSMSEPADLAVEVYDWARPAIV